MTNIKVNEIIATYTAEEQEYITTTMRFAALVGAFGAPQTDEEFKIFCDDTIKAWREDTAKKAEKEAKKAQREQEKAEALGMTVEEYRAHKKLQAKIRRYENEVMKAEADIKKLEEEIAWKKEYIKKLKGEG